jgi:hypothetical protein
MAEVRRQKNAAINGAKHRAGGTGKQGATPAHRQSPATVATTSRQIWAPSPIVAAFRRVGLVPGRIAISAIARREK